MPNGALPQYVGDPDIVVVAVVTWEDDGSGDDHAPHPPTRENRWQDALDEHSNDAKENANEVHIENTEQAMPSRIARAVLTLRARPACGFWRGNEKLSYSDWVSPGGITTLWKAQMNEMVLF